MAPIVYFQNCFLKKEGGGAYNQILFEILTIGIISGLKKTSTGIALAGRVNKLCVRSGKF